MIEHNNFKGAKARNFSLVFEQMCNFVAINKTRDYNEVIRQLILQCFVILPNERFHSARQIMETIDILFGLQIPEYLIQSGVDKLKAEQLIQQPANTNYTISASVWVQLQKRVDDARALEKKVKQEWLEEILRRFPFLPSDQLWITLKGYLSRAFRRHGIQTVALLNPSIDIAPEYAESLSFLLNEVLKDEFPPEQQANAKDSISNFLATVGHHPDRATYIAQLADGSFNYFSLFSFYHFIQYESKPKHALLQKCRPSTIAKKVCFKPFRDL